MEKLVLASTCVFINQKLKGQSGNFILKLKNKAIFIIKKISSGIKFKLNPIIDDLVYEYIINTATHKKNELSCVQKIK